VVHIGVGTDLTDDRAFTDLSCSYVELHVKTIDSSTFVYMYWWSGQLSFACNVYYLSDARNPSFNVSCTAETSVGSKVDTDIWTHTPTI